jgi:hypothetical protein
MGAFLENHFEVITAFDLFTVPTVTFKLVYCFFIVQSMLASAEYVGGSPK